jgi:hypothetical protein
MRYNEIVFTLEVSFYDTALQPQWAFQPNVTA